VQILYTKDESLRFIYRGHAIVQKIAIWLEYFYRLFGCPPYTLEYVKAGRLVEVTIGKGPSTSFPADGAPKIGIDAPATDQDIPAFA